MAGGEDKQDAFSLRAVYVGSALLKKPNQYLGAKVVDSREPEKERPVS